MFDFSLGEILLIGVVALVVLGPERLPVVARTLGALLARMQRFAASVKSDIRREADRAGLAGLQQDVRETAFALQERFENELHGVNAALAGTVAAVGIEPAVVAPPADDARVAVDPLPAAGEADASAHGEVLACADAAAPMPGTATVLAAPGELSPPARDENQLDLFEELLPPSPHLPSDNSAQ
ncbi:twin-arginine translocase TatA/TatE family subunit [Paludibacterium yongneupense]|uniref:twin-arginine translocase TatA/TatE family subunit n=1 Tax=Paludibacterium yongneupense TaxID=400061 RepID=UPI00041A4DA2